MQRIRGHTVLRAAESAANRALTLVAGLDWRRISYFAGVPLALALYGAANNTHALNAAGIWSTVLFYFAHAFIPWWVTCLSTHTVFVVLRPLRPAAPIIWVIGVIISCVVMIPYMVLVGLELPDASRAATNALNVGSFLIYSGRVLVVWVLVNALFERVVGLPRYRYAAPRRPRADPEPAVPVDTETATPAPRLPDFLSSVDKLESIEDLYSVSAEEHYVRIHTARGDHLVYKKFSDAVEELGTTYGMRVHRSHWVSPFAVRGILRDGKRMFVRLKDGTKLPVSRPYQELVRSRAAECGVRLDVGSTQRARGVPLN